jgi:hypothetical protein
MSAKWIIRVIADAIRPPKQVITMWRKSQEMPYFSLKSLSDWSTKFSPSTQRQKLGPVIQREGWSAWATPSIALDQGTLKGKRLSMTRVAIHLSFGVIMINILPIPKESICSESVNK